MTTKTELKTQIRAKLVECKAIAESHYGRTFASIPANFNKTGVTCAGHFSPANMDFEFNLELGLLNPDDLINDTVPHEYAHYIDSKLHPTNHIRTRGRKRSLHGPTWKRIMNVLGIHNPQRCFSAATYGLEDRPRKRKAKYEYTCGCGCDTTVMMGATRHSRMQRGTSIYTKTGHNGKLTYTGTKTKPVTLSTQPARHSSPNPTRNSKAGTKKSRALQIYKRYASIESRSSIIDRFMTELDMTKAGASTYYAMCKNS